MIFYIMKQKQQLKNLKCINILDSSEMVSIELTILLSIYIYSIVYI